MDDLAVFFRGERLYGDDFTGSQLEQWFEDEREAYANLMNMPESNSGKGRDQQYDFHALNTFHGFSRIRENRFRSALGIGSGDGAEFAPIISRIDQLTIVEASTRFRGADVNGMPIKYVNPSIDGKLPFANGTFDLVTSFGVLHHIPNVSFVLKEIRRITCHGGHVLIREPIFSMGDWSNYRRGLTKHERGIPLRLLIRMAKECGFETVSWSPCWFPLSDLIWRKTRNSPFDSHLLTRFDALMSWFFLWNVTYHRTKFARKFAPTSVFLVLRPSETSGL